jgi:integrase
VASFEFEKQPHRRLNPLTGELVSRPPWRMPTSERPNSHENGWTRNGATVQWGAAEASPKVKLLSGERHRERVVTAQEEAKYLSAALEPVASIAAVLCDTGSRPGECFRMQWEAITWANGR